MNFTGIRSLMRRRFPLMGQYVCMSGFLTKSLDEAGVREGIQNAGRALAYDRRGEEKNVNHNTKQCVKNRKLCAEEMGKLGNLKNTPKLHDQI